MVNLAHCPDIKVLLDKVAGIARDFSPNEREPFHTLAARHEELATGSFDEKTCLEVILRNVEIRKGYRLSEFCADFA